MRESESRTEMEERGQRNRGMKERKGRKRGLYIKQKGRYNLQTAILDVPAVLLKGCQVHSFFLN